ncbi:MAG: glycosyltransferase, partial [Kiloniellales bacterium]|nr:glycosyltransferase [Kiloniellales bacterium]
MQETYNNPYQLDIIDVNLVRQRNPRVSIVIPCWNAENYISRAVESALKQRYQPLEVIVVDDGSTDGSLDVLKSYEKEIRILSGPNRGLSSARNVGIFAAGGDLIQFLDADDVLYEEKVTAGVGAALAAPEKTIVVAPGEMQRASGEIISRPCEQLTADDPFISLLLCAPIQIAAFLFWKRTLISVGGFNEGLCEDFDLYARFCALGYKFKLVPKVGFRIYQRADSMSSIGHRFRSYRPLAYARARALSQKNGTWTPERAETLSRVLLQDSEILLRIGDRSTAILNIRESKKV